MRSTTSVRWNAVFAAWALALLLSLTPEAWGKSDGIEIKSADIALSEDVYRLNADVELVFHPKIEDVINKGVPLHFLIEFELVRVRTFWFDEEIIRAQQDVKLSYNALTRQYQLSTGGVHKNFNSLAEARSELGRIREWPLGDKQLLKRQQTYEAGLRVKLDISQLPKPLQVNALASKDWNLDSDWYQWPVIP